MNHLALACLLLLHSPDGTPLPVYNAGDLVVKPADRHEVTGHVAAGTKSIVYVGGRAFGVRESVDDVMRQKKECP